MIRVFLDSSVLFAAAYSAKGAARDLIQLGLDGKVSLIVNRQVLEETRRNLSLDYPEKVVLLNTLLEELALVVTENPTKAQVLAAAEYTALKDAPIIAAAQNAQVDYLATYDRKHLLDPEDVAEKSGLAIVIPTVIVEKFDSAD